MAGFCDHKSTGYHCDHDTLKYCECEWDSHEDEWDCDSVKWREEHCKNGCRSDHCLSNSEICGNNWKQNPDFCSVLIPGHYTWKDIMTTVSKIEANDNQASSEYGTYENILEHIWNSNNVTMPVDYCLKDGATAYCYRNFPECHKDRPQNQNCDIACDIMTQCTSDFYQLCMDTHDDCQLPPIRDCHQFCIEYQNGGSVLVPSWPGVVGLISLIALIGF